MNWWANVAEFRTLYERACHAENVANEVYYAHRCDRNALAWKKAREIKSRAYSDYSRAVVAAGAAGEKHPEDKGE